MSNNNTMAASQPGPARSRSPARRRQTVWEAVARAERSAHFLALDWEDAVRLAEAADGGDGFLVVLAEERAMGQQLRAERADERAGRAEDNLQAAARSAAMEALRAQQELVQEQRRAERAEERAARAEEHLMEAVTLGLSRKLGGSAAASQKHTTRGCGGKPGQVRR